MKKDPPMPAVANSVLSNIILICLFFIFFPGCKSSQQPPQQLTWTSYIKSDSNYKFSPDSAYKQLVILRKDSAPIDSFNKWISGLGDTNHVHITFFCDGCDKKLMLLTGPGVEAYISGKTAGGGSGCGGTQCGPSGDDGPVFYSVNFALSFDDKDTIAEYTFPNKPTPQKQAVTVAVFDTGIDSSGMGRYMYSSSDPSCLNVQANNGWNFVAENNNWADDYPTRHGTKVTKFVVDEIRKYAENNVKILPVKIHNSNGVASLFNILCGFAYAANRGAQIINASFGYYAPRPKLDKSDPDSCAILLREYVRTYLTKRDILLVAAAGNSCASEYNNDSLGVSTNRGMRDLDSVCFYPASLGRDSRFPNVIAVTTIDTPTHTVSPIQNFSPHVVDVGVQNDLIFFDSLYTFIPPNAPVGTATVTGSSFATPIVTGIICANYYLLPPGRIDKEKILEILENKHIAHRNSSFGSLIRNGIVMRRKK